MAGSFTCFCTSRQKCPLHGHQEYEPEDAAWEQDCRDRLKEIEKARDEENESGEMRELYELLRKIR